MKQVFLTLTALFLCTSMVHADLPFRNHRFSSFSVLEVDANSIVFLGNSITNMNEWWEMFDSNPNIINRGNSGAVSPETLANLEAVIAGKPKKIFLMIGTNDLGTAGLNTPQQVASTLRKIFMRIKKESPRTEVYFQSILPSSLRTESLLLAANDSLKKMCPEFGYTYIDLWDALYGIKQSTSGGLSYDGLHLTAKGYYIWGQKIQQYVGNNCVYSNAALKNAGYSGSHGMRYTLFGDLPVKSSDVLIFGDEMVHGGEWHELLHSDKIKSRGTGWGYPGANITHALAAVSVVLQGRTGNEAPAKMFIYAGVSDVNRTTNPSTTATNYWQIVDKIHTLCPTTKIYVMALQPTATAATNTNNIVPFNAAIKAKAEATDYVTYVDTYTPLVNSTTNVGNTKYFSGNYLYGLGYIKTAQILAQYLEEENVSVLSEEEAQSLIERYAARNALGSAVSAIDDYHAGTDMGHYSAEAIANFSTTTDECYELLTSATATNEELTTRATAINTALNSIRQTIAMPKASKDTCHWYTLNATLRNSLYISATSAAGGVQGNATATRLSNWKFVKRTDGSYDIVNRSNGGYIAPTAAYNTQIQTTATQPQKGWTLSYSNTAGMYIVSSGTVQLNQTNLSGTPIYNWSAGATGTDRDDTGCQFTIEYVEMTMGEDVEETKVPPYSAAAEYAYTLNGASPIELKGALADTLLAMESGTVFISFTPSTTTSMQLLLAACDYSASAFFGAMMNAGKLAVDETSTDGTVGWFTRGTNVRAGQQNNVALTFNKATGVYTYYTNGASNGTVTLPAAAYMANFFGTSTFNQIFLGGAKLGNNANLHPFTGKINDIQVWTNILDAETISMIQARNLSDLPTSIKNPMTESSQKIIYDISGRRVAKPSKGIYIIGGKKIKR